MTTGAFDDATIVFDLDGTLVDTAPDLVRALNETLDLEGLPHVPEARVRHMVGLGARALIERSAAFNNVYYSADRLDQLLKAFIDFYRADIAGRSRPFPGVVDAMKDLAAQGARLSVCTNKRTELSVLLLDKLGLAEMFSAIVGADAVENRKPHPDHYRAAVMRAGGIVRRSVMVGDSSPDVSAAKAAGAPCIIVRFGYADEGEPEKLGADALIDHYSDLIAACGRLLSART